HFPWFRIDRAAALLPRDDATIHIHLWQRHRLRSRRRHYTGESRLLLWPHDERLPAPLDHLLHLSDPDNAQPAALDRGVPRRLATLRNSQSPGRPAVLGLLLAKHERRRERQPCELRSHARIGSSARGSKNHQPVVQHSGIHHTAELYLREF